MIETGEKVRGLQREVARYLLLCQQVLGLEPEEMNVLDYGCGKGNATLALNEFGYRAFGVDVDPERVLRAQERLSSYRYDGPNTIFLMDEGGCTPFADGAFQFVFSQELFEHVRDPAAVTDEIARVTSPNGMGYYVFRPHLAPIEPHFFMPFVHWLPKNQLRKYAILMAAYLGLGKRPEELPQAGPRARAEFLFRYSVDKTYYRPYHVVADAFRTSGLDVCFVATNHRLLVDRRALFHLVNLAPVRAVIEWVMMTFRAVHFLTRAPGRTASREGKIRIGNWTGKWLTAAPVR